MSLDPDRFRAASVRFPCTRDAAKLPLPKEGILTVLVDTREQNIPPFPKDVELARVGQPSGDYTTPLLFGTHAIERKSGPDFLCSFFSDDRDRVMRELERLQDFEHKCIVVEATEDECILLTRAHPNALRGTVSSLFADWDCPVLFAGSAYACGFHIAGILRRWESGMAKALPAVTMAGALREAGERMGLR